MARRGRGAQARRTARCSGADLAVVCVTGVVCVDQLGRCAGFGGALAKILLACRAFGGGEVFRDVSVGFDALLERLAGSLA